MKRFCLLLILAVFFTFPIQAFAVGSVSAEVELPRVGAPKNDGRNDSENKDKGKNNDPIPTIAIPTAPQPTATPVPVNENKKPTPTPVPSSSHSETNSGNQSRNNANTPSNTTSNQTTNSNQRVTASQNTNVINIPQNRDTIRSTRQTTDAPTVLGTTTKNQPAAINKETKSKQQTQETPITKIKNIIAPPSADVQVKGANYYQDERLSPAVTTNLLYASLILFMSGMLVLKFPILAAGVMKIKQKLFRTRKPEPFTIPLIEPK